MKILNPRSLLTTDYLTISSKTQDFYDIQSNQFNFTMVSVSEITNIILLRNNFYLNNSTLLNLQFTTLSDLYSTDKMEIYFSKDQVIANNPNNIIIQSLNSNPSTNLSYSIILNDQNFIGISFSDSKCNPCLSNSTINYNFYGFSNIGTTKLPTISNKILVKDQKGYSIEEKNQNFYVRPNLASGNLSIISFNCSNKTTGADANLTILFKTQNSVSNGMLFISFPYEFIFVGNNNPNKICQLKSNSTYICLINFIKGANFGEFISSVYVYNTTFDSNSIVELILYNTIKNRPSNQTIVTTDNSIFFFTLDSNNNTIDSTFEKANDHLPSQLNNFNNIIFQRNNNSVSSNTDLSISFEILNRVSKNSKFFIHLPENQISSTDQTKCYGFYSNAYYPLLCNISNQNSYTIIGFSEYCSKNNTGFSYCLENTFFSIKITNLTNAFSVQNTRNYSIKIFSSKEDNLFYFEERTKEIFFNEELQMSNFQNFKLKINETRVTMPVSINIGFTIPSAIPQNGLIYLDLPDNLFYSLNETCKFYSFGSISVNKNCKIISKPSIIYDGFQIEKINLTDICANSNDCLAGKTFDLIFSAIHQNYYTNANHFISLQSFTSSNENISFFNYNASNLTLTQFNLDENFFVKRENANLNQTSTIRMDFIIPSKFIYNATMKFSLPKNQVLINPNTIKIMMISPILQSVSAYQLLLNNDDYYFLIINQTFCPSFCQKNMNISFNLLLLSNPIFILYKSFNFFLLKVYYEKETQFIYSTYNGVFADLELLIPSLLNVSINRTNQFLNELINIYINLTNARNLSDENLVFELPDKMIYLNNSSENPNISIFNGNSFSKNQTNQTLINKTIDQYGNFYVNNLQIEKICNSFCPTGQSITLKISNIRNPALFFSNLNNLNLKILLLDSNFSIMNQITYNSKNIQPLIIMLSIQTFAITRNTSIPSSFSSITLDFELSSYLLVESLIQITIPKTQIILTNASFCLNKINNNRISCNFNSNNTHNIVLFEEYCTGSSLNCSSSRKFTIIIDNCINPSKTPLKLFLNSLQIFAYSSYLDPYQITQDNLFLMPDIYKFYLNSIKITRNNNRAGSLTSYSFQITLPQTLSSDVLFLINFPEFLAYNPSNSNLNCNNYTCQTKIMENFSYIAQIFINDACNSGTSCLINKEIKLSFDVKNPGNTYDYQTNHNFSVIIETNDGQIDIARGDVSANLLSIITPGSFVSPMIKSSSYQVGQAMNWNITFLITNNFLNNENSGKITIYLPIEIGLLSSCFCSGYIKNYGEISCSIEINKNILNLVHNYKNDSIMDGSEIQVNIFNIMNPISTKPIVSLGLSSIGKINGKLVKFDETMDGIIYKAMYGGPINLISIIRDKNVLSAEISLIFNFTTTNKNENNGMILINVINSDEINFSSVNSLSCFDNIDKIFLNCTKLIESSILISNLSSFPSNNSWSFLIKGLKNMYYIDEFINNFHSFSIETKTFENYLIDSIYSNLHALPKLQYGSLNVLKLSRSSDVVTDEISIKIQITLSNQIYQNNSFLKLSFSKEFLLISKLFNLKCLMNEIVLPCSNSVYFDEYSIKDLSIYSLNLIQQTNYYNITIDSGVRNNFYVYLFSQTMIIQTYLMVSERNINGLLDQATIDSNDFLSKMSPQMIVNASISCFDCSVNKTTDFIIRFTIKHIFLLNMWIKIDIPKTVFFEGFAKNQKKCVGLIGFNENIDCFLDNQVLWVNDSFINLVKPGLFSFKVKMMKNPSKSGDFIGFNLSTYYNGSFLMDESNQSN